jgi:hypothetical protein
MVFIPEKLVENRVPFQPWRSVATVLLRNQSSPRENIVVQS